MLSCGFTERREHDRRCDSNVRGHAQGVAGRAPSWPIWASVALFMLIEMQAGFGYTRDLSLHIPGGVLVFGLMIAMLIVTWTKVTIRRSDQAPSEQSGESA